MITTIKDMVNWGMGTWVSLVVYMTDAMIQLSIIVGAILYMASCFVVADVVALAVYPCVPMNETRHFVNVHTQCLINPLLTIVGFKPMVCQ